MRPVRMLLALVAVAGLGGCLRVYEPTWTPEGPAQVEQYVDEFHESGWSLSSDSPPR